MVKDHSDSERENPAMVILYDHPTDRVAHTTAFITPVMEHWLEREIAQSGIDPTTHHIRADALPRSYISPLINIEIILSYH